MKKRLFIIFSVILLVVLVIVAFLATVKIEKVEEEPQREVSINNNLNDDALLQVLRGEREFIDSTGTETLITDFKIEDKIVSVNAYVLTDLDGDDRNEVIATTDSYYGHYLALSIDRNNVIYGYSINSNEIKYINKDGVIYSDKDNKQVYKRLKFKKNKYKFIEFASFQDDKYILNKEEVDEDTYKKYEEDYITRGLVTFKSLDSKWMEKTISNKYSLDNIKSLYVDLDNMSFIFVSDKSYDNFNNDLINDKFNLYYMDSNNNIGKVNIRRSGEEILKDNNEINDNKTVSFYDEETQYLIIINNNDKMSSELDNNLSAYYFKYYNKNIQYLGKNTITDIHSVLDEEQINNLS